MGATSVDRVRVGWVEERSEVPSDLARQFLADYRAAYLPLETLSPARQALTDEEFLAAMDNRSIAKFVGWGRDGNACAMAVMAKDLAAVPWVSVPYFAARFPEHHARGAIYYFHAAFVRPENQGGPWLRLLLEALAGVLAKDRAVAAFDCCDYTVDVARLPEMFTRVSSRLCAVEPTELDRQHYFGYLFQEG